MKRKNIAQQPMNEWNILVCDPFATTGTHPLTLTYPNDQRRAAYASFLTLDNPTYLAKLLCHLENSFSYFLKFQYIKC